MTKWRWGFLGVNLILILSLFFLIRHRPFEFHRQVTTDLPVYGTVPGFALVERSGRTFQNTDLKGKVWVADFIFTRCQGQCPIMSQAMSRLRPRLKNIAFVSFSVDPEFDTADVLSRYADSYHADPENWFFLTGDSKTLNHITSSFHMNEIGEPAFHSLNFVLIDQRGLIRGYYDSSVEENLRQLERDARRLLAEPHVRTPFVSGSFYPAAAEELKEMIDGFLAKVPEQKPLDGKLVALIAPHAGYVYSGQTAAVAYKLLAGASYDTVVLIGPYHRAFFPGASIWRSGAWKTPLGEVAVDEELVGAIVKENRDFEFTDDAHLAEHSLETQVPFLQRLLKNFKIVPILVSDPSPENYERLAKAVLKNSEGKNVLIVASTDMSHYYTDETARKMDRLTLDLIQKKDSGGLLREMELKNSELCGGAAVLTVLEIAKLMGGTQVQLLHYSTSADSTGGKARVVGYGALAIYKKGESRPVEQTGLNAAQEKELLKIARQTVETYVKSGQAPDIASSDPILKEDRGVFVTLKKQGKLRGCIGTILPKEPLYLAVRNMAIQSAVDDPRFQRVDTSELKDLSYEISVLSVPQRVPSAEHIVLGKHGVILKKGSRQGVFLPKVAEETAWNKDRFFGELCSQKAGLPWDCWQDSSTELYTFTAQEFSE